MKKKNIETDFIKFIIDKYSPSPGATASKDDNKNPSPDAKDEDEEVVEKLLMEYKKIKDQYEYYRLQNKRG